jgi:ABC-type nickel/cobalt efflux system permease component RcnA
MDSPNVAIVLLFAFLLGLRHASDPDHLVALTTLVAGTKERAGRAAARLGGSWGLGHALALVVFGLPVVLLHALLPATVQRIAESAVGVIIGFLAIRLIVRWRRGAFHLHGHEHDGVQHTHVHAHDHAHGHAHEHRVRSPLQAFLIGITHGTGGSAAVGILLLASIPSQAVAAIALCIFAAGTAISMCVLSGAFGLLLSTGPARRGFRLAVLPLAISSLVFGALYLGAAWTNAIPL